MEVHADEPVAVVDKHGVALEEHFIGKDYRSRRNCQDWRANRRIVVGPHVSLFGHFAVVHPLHAERLAHAHWPYRRPKGQRKLRRSFFRPPYLSQQHLVTRVTLQVSSPETMCKGCHEAEHSGPPARGWLGECREG